MEHDPQFIGWVGGLAGAAIGVAGGLFGTYVSIRQAQSANERAFLIRASALMWATILAFFVVMYLTPQPYQALLWIPYGLALPIAVLYGNRALARIRNEDAAASRSGEA